MIIVVEGPMPYLGALVGLLEGSYSPPYVNYVTSVDIIHNDNKRAILKINASGYGSALVDVVIPSFTIIQNNAFEWISASGFEEVV